MEARRYQLKNGIWLNIREGEVADAPRVLEYIDAISRESDNLSFGPGEFDLNLQQEEDVIRDTQKADSALFILGCVDDRIVSLLTFSGGKRPRMRHRGEFGISVRQEFWNLGIGGLMLDILVDWARRSGVVTKINPRVRCDNEHGITLYTHKGFVKEGTIRRDMRIGNTYIDCFWMGLSL